MASTNIALSYPYNTDSEKNTENKVSCESLGKFMEQKWDYSMNESDKDSTLLECWFQQVRDCGGIDLC